MTFAEARISNPRVFVRAFVEGLEIDQRSWRAGFASVTRDGATDCPAGLDMFSFYLGRAEARRYGGKKKAA